MSGKYMVFLQKKKLWEDVKPDVNSAVKELMDEFNLTETEARRVLMDYFKSVLPYESERGANFIRNLLKKT